MRDRGLMTLKFRHQHPAIQNKNPISPPLSPHPVSIPPLHDSPGEGPGVRATRSVILPVKKYNRKIRCLIY